jgi:hypothetical protein
MRIHKAGQHDFACAVNLGNLFAILLKPRIAKCVFRRSDRNNLPAYTKNSPFVDNPELLQLRSPSRPGRNCPQCKELPDVDEQQRPGCLRMLLGLKVSQQQGPLSALIPNRNSYIGLFGELFRFFITCVYMPNNSHSRIRSQHALDSLGHHLGTVSNRDLTCV